MRENKVASLLIKLRKDFEFTQSNLANQLGVSFQAVSKWERGENLPDAFTLVELAKIYSITVDEILNGEVIYREVEVELKGLPLKRIFLLFTVGIVMIVTSPVWYFTFKEYEAVGIIALILSVIIGICLVIFSAYKYENAQQKAHGYQENTKLENIVYGSSFVVFFVLGMGFQLWYISWIAFIVGWIVIQALEKE